MTKGYETILKPTDPNLSGQEKKKLLKDYDFVKEKIDEPDKAVNMDLILFIAQVKYCIYEKAGFKIVFEVKELQVPFLTPDISDLTAQYSTSMESESGDE